jgi:mRNA interferase MazF
MPSFRQGDVVRVPFPYTDRPIRQYRPALVVSHGGVGPHGGLLWVVMITSAANPPWPGDVALGPQHRTMGLPAPSLARPAKIATIEAAQADRIGRLKPTLLASVLSGIERTLGFSDQRRER